MSRTCVRYSSASESDPRESDREAPESRRSRGATCKFASLTYLGQHRSAFAVVPKAKQLPELLPPSPKGGEEFWPNLRQAAQGCIMGRMGTDARYFLSLVTQLEDWHADDVRATDIRPLGSGAQTPSGHRILRRNRYPGPDWRRLYRAAGGNPDAQTHLIKAVEDELYGLSHSPSLSSPASGLHRGTAEWRRAIAMADGSLRAVARRFGISHVEVRRYRAQFSQSPLELRGGE